MKLNEINPLRKLIVRETYTPFIQRVPTYNNKVYGIDSELLIAEGAGMADIYIGSNPEKSKVEFTLNTNGELFYFIIRNSKRQ